MALQRESDAPQVSHKVELEGEYPDTEVVIEHSTATDPTRQISRFPIWGREFAGEGDAESVRVLIMTWVQGGSGGLLGTPCRPRGRHHLG